MLENTNALIASILAIEHEKQYVTAEMEGTEDEEELNDLGYYFIDLEAALASLIVEYRERAALDPKLPDISQILAEEAGEGDEEEEDEEDIVKN